ncbi:MAG TPA: hypothetical protein DCS67_10665 [Clostridiales bacterium UBA8960]|nr:hypothetical protein [Clostridiales bacterium UBA8960]
MLKLASKGSLFTLLILLSVVTSACEMSDKGEQLTTTAEGPSSAVLFSDFAYPVGSNHEIKFLVPNGLEIHSIESDSNKVYIQYPQFSGLKNKMIEEKLNRSVEAMTQEMKAQLDPKTIVPYRGIRKFIAEEATASYVSLQGYTSYNHNNIVSVQLHGSGEYGSMWISIVKGLTIDLNTGDSVPLRALFVDGYDYISAINDAIMKEVTKTHGMGDTEMGYGYELIRPFTGIDENQAYILGEQGIIILFDENDDQFDHTFSTVTFMMDYALFEEQLAIDARYYAKEDCLFEDETERRMLTSWKKSGHYENEMLSGEIKGGTYYITTYSSTERLDNVFKQMIEDAKAEIMAISFEGKDNFADVSLSKMPIGDYVAITGYFGIYSNANSDSKEIYALYDKNDTLVGSPDLFKPNFDYHRVVQRIIKLACDENRDYDYEKIMAAYDHLSFELDYRGIVVKVLYDNPLHYNNYFRYNIPFHEFGIENLVIFD